MKLMIIGPQGSGKGTYASMISTKLCIPHISTGQIFRDNIAAGTDLGKTVEKYIKEGKLVPDEVTMNVVKERLERPDCKNGFIFDGFPRNISQAELLDSFSKLDAVIYLDVKKDILLERLTSRRTCNKCGKIYNLLFAKPKKQGVCDDCAGELIVRDDEKPEAIKARLAIYEKDTKPLIDYYSKKGVIRTFKCSNRDALPEENIKIILKLILPIERTLVVLKPDAMRDNLAGEIIKRYQQSGLEIVGMKMLRVSKKMAEKHYTTSDEQIVGMGNKTLQSAKDNNKMDNVTRLFGTQDPKKIGMELRSWLIKFITSRPVIAMVLEGENAIKNVRSISGFTDPSRAEKGTIRGDFGKDSIDKANSDGRATENLVHSSGSLDEAKSEIALWFKKDELY